MLTNFADCGLLGAEKEKLDSSFGGVLVELSGKYAGAADLRPKIEAAILEDFPDADLSGAWGAEDREQKTEDGKTLEQCVSALELLRSRLEGCPALHFHPGIDISDSDRMECMHQAFELLADALPDIEFLLSTGAKIMPDHPGFCHWVLL